MWDEPDGFVQDPPRVSRTAVAWNTDQAGMYDEDMSVVLTIF